MGQLELPSMKPIDDRNAVATALVRRFHLGDASIRGELCNTELHRLGAFLLPPRAVYLNRDPIPDFSQARGYGTLGSRAFQDLGASEFLKFLQREIAVGKFSEGFSWTLAVVIGAWQVVRTGDDFSNIKRHLRAAHDNPTKISGLLPSILVDRARGIEKLQELSLRHQDCGLGRTPEQQALFHSLTRAKNSVSSEARLWEIEKPERVLRAEGALIDILCHCEREIRTLGRSGGKNSASL